MHNRESEGFGKRIDSVSFVQQHYKPEVYSFAQNDSHVETHRSPHSTPSPFPAQCTSRTVETTQRATMSLFSRLGPIAGP